MRIELIALFLTEVMISYVVCIIMLNMKTLLEKDL